MQYVYIIFADFDEWLVAVHDNLLIAATDSMDLLKKTERVLKRCQEFNIQLIMAKSRFEVDSILFFGYRLEKGKYVRSKTYRTILQLNSSTNYPLSV